MTLEQLKKDEFSSSSYEMNDALTANIREGNITDHNLIRSNIDLIIKRAKAEALVKILNEVESQATNLM